MLRLFLSDDLKPSLNREHKRREALYDIFFEEYFY
jgi:hypothetical protein